MRIHLAHSLLGVSAIHLPASQTKVQTSISITAPDTASGCGGCICAGLCRPSANVDECSSDDVLPYVAQLELVQTCSCGSNQMPYPKSPPPPSASPSFEPASWKQLLCRVHPHVRRRASPLELPSSAGRGMLKTNDWPVPFHLPDAETSFVPGIFSASVREARPPRR